MYVLIGNAWWSVFRLEFLWEAGALVLLNSSFSQKSEQRYSSQINCCGTYFEKLLHAYDGLKRREMFK
jgi:hypothetical protein